MAQATQFALGLFHDRFGRLRFGEAFAEFLDLLLDAFLALAEFLLNGFELFAQIGLALLVGEGGGDVLLDFLLQSGQFKLGVDALVDQADAPGNVQFLEQLLLLRRFEVQRAGQKISQLSRAFDVQQGDPGGLGFLAAQFKELEGGFAQAAHRGFEGLVAARRQFRGQDLDFGPDERMGQQHLAPRHSLQGLDHNDDLFLSAANELEDRGGHAHRIEVIRAGLVLPGIFLGEDADDLGLGEGFFEQFPRGRPANVQGHDHAGKEDGVPDRENGEHAGNRRRFGRPGGGVGGLVRGGRHGFGFRRGGGLAAGGGWGGGRPGAATRDEGGGAAFHGAVLNGR